MWRVWSWSSGSVGKIGADIALESWLMTVQISALFGSEPSSLLPIFSSFTQRTSQSCLNHSQEPCEWADADLGILCVQSEQILHLKVGCPNFGPVWGSAIYPTSCMEPAVTTCNLQPAARHHCPSQFVITSQLLLSGHPSSVTSSDLINTHHLSAVCRAQSGKCGRELDKMFGATKILPQIMKLGLRTLGSPISCPKLGNCSQGSPLLPWNTVGTWKPMYTS